MSNIIDKIQVSGVTYNLPSGGGSGSTTVELTQAEYDALVSGGTVDPDTYYIITDATPQDMSQYWTSAQTNSAITEAVSGKADSSAVTQEISAAVSGKVDTSTYNTYTAATDTALASKQTTLTAGTGIDITDNVISATGGGGKAISGGTNISVTTGETADTISCTLPITATSNNSLIFLASNTNRNITNSIVGGNDNDVKNTQYSFIFGQSNMLSGVTSRANIIGYGNKSYKSDTFVGGIYNKALNHYETDFGVYNNSVSASTTFGDSGNTLFSVGNGTANNARHNAFEIRQNGDIYITKNGQDVKLQDQLGGGGGVNVVQTTGTSTTDVMSQNAVTNAFNEYTVRKDSDNGIVRFWTWKSPNYPYGQNSINNFAINGRCPLSKENGVNSSIWQFNLVETSAITTSVNSSSTDSQVPSAKAVYDALQEGGGGGGGMTEDDELLLATALTDLNDRKIDASDVKSNYQKKGDYVTTNTLNTRLADYETALDEQNVEKVTAYALNDLNNRVTDNTTALGGMKLVKITESEYAALTTKDENTLYIVVADPS